MSIRIRLIDPKLVTVVVPVLPTDPAPAEDMGALVAAALGETPAGATSVPAAPALRLACHYKGPNTLAEWLASFASRTTTDVVQEILASWSGLGEGDSDAAPLVTRQAIAALLDQVEPEPKPDGSAQTLFMAIVDGYLAALSEAAAKN